MARETAFSIVWQPYATQSPTGRLLVQPLSFPFFLDGNNYATLQAGLSARIDARGLMLGILVAYDDPSPFADTPRPTQLDEALADLVAVLGAPSLEVALLDASAYLRQNHGAEIAQIALVTATKVVPARSDI